MAELLDARGVKIEPGDTAIYGFGVSRSIAMAEAVVLGERVPVDVGFGSATDMKVSLTASGRVRLRVVRRSYSDGVAPVVAVAPDRLVVLKDTGDLDAFGDVEPYLPPSPLPTQDEEARADIEKRIEQAKDALRAERPPEYWSYGEDGDTDAMILSRYHKYYERQLDMYRKQLKALDDN